MASSRPSVALLGATGSIGSQTLEVLRCEEDHFDVIAIAGAHQLEALAAIAKEFHVSRIGVVDVSDREILAGMIAMARSRSGSLPF